MASAVGHDRPLRLRPIALFDRRASRLSGDDGADLSRAAALGADVARSAGDRAWRHRLAVDGRLVPTDPQGLSLLAARRTAAARYRAVLHGRHVGFGDPVLARTRRRVERPLSSGSTLVGGKRGDKIRPPAVNEMKQHGGEPAEAFDLVPQIAAAHRLAGEGGDTGLRKGGLASPG